MDRTDVLTARLATQRLSGPPADGPGQVVRELPCVQALEEQTMRKLVSRAA